MNELDEYIIEKLILELIKFKMGFEEYLNKNN